MLNEEKRFLAFKRDLKTTFGDRSQEFGEDLKATLYTLWWAGAQFMLQEAQEDGADEDGDVLNGWIQKHRDWSNQTPLEPYIAPPRGPERPTTPSTPPVHIQAHPRPTPNKGELVVKAAFKTLEGQEFNARGLEDAVALLRYSTSSLSADYSVEYLIDFAARQGWLQQKQRPLGHHGHENYFIVDTEST